LQTTHPEKFKTDYDGSGFGSANVEELYTLLEALDECGGYIGIEGSQDWALEHRCEISKLEKENEELRRLLLGIDNANMAARGLWFQTESRAASDLTTL
jgi:hypothetical protein